MDRLVHNRQIEVALTVRGLHKLHNGGKFGSAMPEPVFADGPNSEFVGVVEIDVIDMNRKVYGLTSCSSSAPSTEWCELDLRPGLG